MTGLMKPRCRWASWSASAISPAHKGAAALVPVAGPTMAWSAWPLTETTARPVLKAASPATSGTPRVASALETGVLVAGSGEQVAEPAARGGGAVAGRGRRGKGVPRGLADISAGGPVGGQAGAAGGEHQGVGGRQADLLDRDSQPEVQVAGRPFVAGGGHHSDVLVPVRPQSRLHAGRLGAGEVVLADAGADRQHAAVGGAETQERGHRRGEVRGAAHRRPLDQDDGYGGARGDRVHHLGVLHLLAASQPR